MPFDSKTSKTLSFSVLPLLDNFDLNYLSLLRKIGLLNIHYDVMDEFTGTRGFDTTHLESLKKLGFKVNVHFMVKNISTKLVEFIKYPFDGISFHVEALTNVKDGLEYIQFIKNNEKKAGLAFKFDTNFENYIELISQIDYVTLMSVVPGKGGQKYNPIVEENSKKLQELCLKNKISLPIVEFDGGITEIEIQKLWSSGNIFVSGSWFNNLDFDKKKKLIDLIDSNKLWNPFLN